MKCAVSQTRKCLLENVGNSFQLNKGLLILCFSLRAPRSFSIVITLQLKFLSARHQPLPFWNITISSSVLWLVKQGVISNWHARASLPTNHHNCPIDCTTWSILTNGAKENFWCIFTWYLLTDYGEWTSYFHTLIQYYNIENLQVQWNRFQNQSIARKRFI